MKHKVTNVTPCKNPSYKKRSLTKVIAAFLGVNLLTVSASGYINVAFSRERIAEITKEEKNNIDGYLPDDDVAIGAADRRITYKLLKNVKHLTLDMNHMDDLSNLAKYPNLRTIAILNAQELTDRDLDYLSASSVTSISLDFDTNVILSKPKESLDLGKLKDKEIMFFSLDYENEFDRVIICSFLKNVDEDSLDADMKRAYNQSCKLDEIVQSLDLDQEYNPKAKFFKALKFVTDRIVYDPDVRYFGTEWSTIDEETKSQVVTNYNKYSISSVLENDSPKTYGVCINYTDLLTALSYKLGLDVYPYCGGNHAWNVVNFGDGYKYVDATWLDDTLSYSLDINAYYNDGISDSFKDIIYENLKSNVIRDMDESYYNTYTSDLTPESFSSKPKEVEYYNEGKDGTYTYHNVNSIIPFLAFYLTSMTYICLISMDSEPSLIRQREKEKRSSNGVKLENSEYHNQNI